MRNGVCFSRCNASLLRLAVAGNDALLGAAVLAEDLGVNGLAIFFRPVATLRISDGDGASHDDKDGDDDLRPFLHATLLLK
jgi:hypothetical protein